MKNIAKIRKKILKDYELNRPIDKIDIFNLPDKENIISLTDKLVRLIFPGYFRDKNNKYISIEINIATLLEDIAYLLNKEICTVLNDETKAEEIIIKFLSEIPNIRSIINTDLEAFYNGDPAATSKDEIILSYPGIYTVVVYRLAHTLWNLNVPLIPRIMSEYAHSKTGIDIHPGATIGEYFFIDHGTGIVIGETTIIGKHVKIYQGVTLGGLSTRGGRSLKDVKRHPTIKDNVTIYAGASILGGDTIIGENVVVGSNAFITKSVKPNTRVVTKYMEE